MDRAEEIRRNLDEVRARIEQAAQRSGRDPADIQLVAVSKTWPAEDVRAAWQAGQRDFGENYAQELAAKRAALADCEDIRWHFIGALQSNKAKLVVPGTTLVHAVDRASLGDALSRRAKLANVTQDALVEVNIAGEASKAGIAPRDVDVLVNALAGYDGLRVRGLMCIPPFADDPEDSRPHFRRLRELSKRIRAHHPDLEWLSMGMSGDYEVAIEEGATHVRVGTAIFGARAKKA